MVIFAGYYFYSQACSSGNISKYMLMYDITMLLVVIGGNIYWACMGVKSKNSLIPNTLQIMCSPAYKFVTNYNVSRQTFACLHIFLLVPWLGSMPLLYTSNDIIHCLQFTIVSTLYFIVALTAALIELIYSFIHYNTISKSVGSNQKEGHNSNQLLS